MLCLLTATLKAAPSVQSGENHTDVLTCDQYLVYCKFKLLQGIQFYKLLHVQVGEVSQLNGIKNKYNITL